MAARKLKSLGHQRVDLLRYPPMALVFLMIKLALLVAVVPFVSHAQEIKPTDRTDQSAVVFVYHRFGEDQYPSTNIRLEQFDQQIAFLKAEGFNFLSLDQFLNHMKTNTAFPEKSILFTVDDAYKSVLTQAWPRLKKAGIPLTVFVATDVVDSGFKGYLSWDDIRALEKDGVAIGHHTASHMHMVHEGVAAAKANIEKASARFKAELGYVPRVFAYPYGEYSSAVKTLVAEKFDMAFAQFSGPAALDADLFALPRYAINEQYGAESRFKLVARSRALPVSEVIPLDPYLDDQQKNPPLVGFTLPKSLGTARDLTCYPGHMGGERATILRPAAGRFEIRFDKPFPKGRSRLNCTLLGPDKRWYWFGRYFLVPGGKLD